MARRSAHSVSSTYRERLAALEAAWDGLPDKIAAAMAEAAKELTPHAAHEALSDRVAILESRVAFSAGAGKVEDRNRTQAQEWARTLTPIILTLCATFVGSIWALQIGGP